jgi:N-acetylglucosaminyldiphosphoundecaprenol N-acetyl-beta-D-mannosaminyltransferase
VTPNVDHVCRFQKDSVFREAYQGSFLTLADGVPLIWASRMLRKPIREKISGSDLVYWLSEHAAHKGHSVFLFGAADGVAEKAGAELARLYPGLRIAGTYSPPLGFEKSREGVEEALERIRSSHADLCMVALGCPKQEFWMQEHGSATGVPVSIGIGAGLDFVAGVTRRAPRIVQRVGFEWFWRMCQDPKRLGKRYLVDDRAFFYLVWREWRSGTAGRLA